MVPGSAHLLDNGFSEPRCVGVCHMGALKFLKESELGEIREKSMDLNSRRARPRVCYLNIPKHFVGGTLFDPKKMEVISCAQCILASESIQKKTLSDGFGDFWFEGLEKDLWSLEIRAEGHETKIIEAINTESSVNLGDIPLS